MPFLVKILIFIEVLMAAGLVAFRYSLKSQYRNVVSSTTIVFSIATPIVALFCASFYIFVIYLIAFTAFSARSRAQLAANYAFMLPLMPILSQDVRIGSMYLLAMTTALAMNIGALIAFFISPRERSYAKTSLDSGVILLVVIFTYIYTHDVNFTSFLRGLIGAVLGIAGPYLLISRGMNSRADVERLLLRLSLGAFLTAVVSIFQAGKKWLLFQAYYDTLHVPIPFGTLTLAIRAGLLRTGGAMLDYSAAGVFFAAVLCIMPMLRARFHFVGFWTVLAILIGGLLATQSRGAWIAAVMGYLFVLAFRRQWGKVALLAGAGIVAEGMTLLFANSGILASITGKTTEAASTVSYRKQLAIRGFEQVKSHPIFGQSPEQLVANLPDLMQGQHIVDFVNSHLFIAMAGGVPLFIAWCCIWLAPVFEAWRHPSRGTIGSDLIEAPAAMIVAVMVAITATSLIDRNLIWPLIAVAMAGPCFALARQQSRTTSQPYSPFIRMGANAPQTATALR